MTTENEERKAPVEAEEENQIDSSQRVARNEVAEHEEGQIVEQQGDDSSDEEERKELERLYGKGRFENVKVKVKQGKGSQLPKRVVVQKKEGESGSNSEDDEEEP